MHNDPRSRTAASPQLNPENADKPVFINIKAPNFGALMSLISFFVSANENLARPLQYLLQVIRFTTRFGDLGTGRPGIPLFTPGADRHAMRPPFWDPWYRQAGGSLFTPDRRVTRSPPRFGNPDTGRSGIPAFITRGDGSPAASGHRPCCRPSLPAAAAPPTPSATTLRHSLACASSRLCR